MANFAAPFVSPSKQSSILHVTFLFADILYIKLLILKAHYYLKNIVGWKMTNGNNAHVSHLEETEYSVN